jgi:hypothetical protein
MANRQLVQLPFTEIGLSLLTTRKQFLFFKRST